MLGETFTDRESVIAAADRIEKAAQIVMVSCGARGGLLFTTDTKLVAHVPIEADLVKNTVGCGDALLAGFLAGMRSARGVVDSFRFALAVATSAAMSPAPAQVERRQIDQFYNSVIVETITP